MAIVSTYNKTTRLLSWLFWHVIITLYTLACHLLNMDIYFFVHKGIYSLYLWYIQKGESGRGKTGPNEARYVVWALIGELLIFFSYLLVLTNIYCMYGYQNTKYLTCRASVNHHHTIAPNHCQHNQLPYHPTQFPPHSFPTPLISHMATWWTAGGLETQRVLSPLWDQDHGNLQQKTNEFENNNI